MPKKIVLKILLLFLSWRVLLFLVGGMADSFFVYAPSFPYADALLADFGVSRELFSWGNFDGVHYLTIARQGYMQVDLIQAFFPLYPLVMTFVSSLGLSSLWSGLFISNAMTFVMLLLFYQLVNKNSDEKTAWWSLVALLIFPTSLFFGAIYNEALFMSLVFGSFLLAGNKKWLWAGLVAALATSTRIVGVFLFPALLIQWLYPSYVVFSKKIWPKIWQKVKDRPQNLFFISLTLLGLGSYMTYLHFNFNDAFYFLHVQSEFGAGRQENLVLLPQVMWRYLKILVTAKPIDWKYYTYAQDLVLSLGSLTVLLAFWKKIKPSWLVFSLGAWFLPTLTGTFSSMPRYILACFPIFILWGGWLKTAKPVWKYLSLTISGILLIINTLLFIQGYWVS